MAQSAPVDQGNFDNAKLYVWVKGLEGKLNSLVREVDLLKNELVKKNSAMGKEVRVMSDEVLELRRQHDHTVQKMELMIKELKQTAGLEEVQVIKKYLEFWNPLQFVSQRDLERAVDARVVISEQVIPQGSVMDKKRGRTHE